MVASPSFLFAFNVGQAFLGPVGHPITVPKEQIDYTDLDSSGIDLGDLAVVFPRGERKAGYRYSIRSGETAQRGAYRQLRMTGTERRLPSYLDIGDRLLVLICKYGPESLVILEYRHGDGQA
ncbi:MAG: hypothetical protein ACR2L6_00480 [Gemmatimonadaceae bacterium]